MIKVTHDQKITRKNTLMNLMEYLQMDTAELVRLLGDSIWTGRLYNARSMGTVNTYPTDDWIKEMAPIFGISQEIMKGDTAWTESHPIKPKPPRRSKIGEQASASTSPTTPPPNVTTTPATSGPKFRAGQTLVAFLNGSTDRTTRSLAEDLARNDEEIPLLLEALNEILIDEKPDEKLKIIDRLCDQFNLNPDDFKFEVPTAKPAAKPATPKPAARPAAKATPKPVPARTAPPKPAAPKPPAAKPATAKSTSKDAKTGGTEKATAKTEDSMKVTPSIAGKLPGLGVMIERDAKGCYIQLPAAFVGDLLWTQLTGAKISANGKPSAKVPQAEKPAGIAVTTSHAGKLSNRQDLAIRKEGDKYLIRLPDLLSMEILWKETLEKGVKG